MQLVPLRFVPRFAAPVPDAAKPPKKKKSKAPLVARPPREARPAKDNELWVGGLPAPYATCKALKQLLWWGSAR
jgi:hypothetical protein